MMVKDSDVSYAARFCSPLLVTPSCSLCFPFQMELEMGIHSELFVFLLAAPVNNQRLFVQIYN